MEEQRDNLLDAFAEFAEAHPQDVLPLIAGLFVALFEFSVENEGGDPKKEIRVSGDGLRDIVICAKPNAKVKRRQSRPLECIVRAVYCKSRLAFNAALILGMTSGATLPRSFFIRLF